MQTPEQRAVADALINRWHTQAAELVCLMRMPEFGVPVELVASFTELVAGYLATAYTQGASDGTKQVVTLFRSQP